MDIKKSLQILELDRTATQEDINQAYKDSVSVWHPDRFTYNNPRLKRKAEEKIKEVNTAYETLKSFYAQRELRNGLEKDSPYTDEADSRGAEETTGADKRRDSTEAAFEIGTQLVLTAWSYFSTKLRKMVDNQVKPKEVDKQGENKR